MPTVAAMISAASTASCRHASSAAITRDQRDVEQQRRERRQRKTALRIQQRHHHGHRPGKGEIRQHQAGVVDGKLQRLATGKARRQRGDDERHQECRSKPMPRSARR